MKNKSSYGECENCGGDVVERLVTKILSVDGHLHQFEKVPTGVCVKCGTRLYKGTVLEQLEHLARSRSRSRVKRRISVPVRDYIPAATA